MKIALVIERTDSSRGGRETSAAQIAAGLVRRGHDVTVLCQRGCPLAEGVKVRELGGKGLFRVRKLKDFVARAGAAIREQHYDIVHAMLPLPGANVYQLRGGTAPAQRAASLRRRSPVSRPLVWLLERLNFRRNLMAELERQVVGNGDVLCLPVSQMVAAELERFYRRSAGLRVIYNGVDVPAVDDAQRADWRQKTRYELGVKSDEMVFLCVAANFELKGVAETIAAFARWYYARPSRPEARLVIVGREIAEGYQRIAGLREVGKQVVFVPPTLEVFRWYSAADACILLSWYDPCSRVVLEATRWGVPSITTVFNGAAEVLSRGAGIVVSSPKNSREVVKAMDDLADPASRQRRRRACLDVADSLSMDRHVEELLEAYAAVTGRK